jgi:hypothetical protein
MSITENLRIALALLAALALLCGGCDTTGDDDDDNDDAADDDVADDDDDDDDFSDDDDTGDDDTGDDDTGDDDTADEEPWEIPTASGVTCIDTEPNDCVYGKDSDIDAEWPACRQICEDFVSGDGTADVISGTLDPIVDETWDGDNDTYYFTLGADGYLYGSMSWDYEPGDQDWYMVCLYEDKKNPLDWYIMSDATVDLTHPEQGVSVVPMDAGTECYAWVVGYLSDDSTEDYTLSLWISPS